MPRKKMGPSTQVYFRVPKADEVVLAWLEAQDSASMSLRELIRRDALSHGIRDIMSMSSAEYAARSGMGMPGGYVPVMAQPVPQALVASEQAEVARKPRKSVRKPKVVEIQDIEPVAPSLPSLPKQPIVSDQSESARRLADMSAMLNG